MTRDAPTASSSDGSPTSTSNPTTTPKHSSQSYDPHPAQHPPRPGHPQRDDPRATSRRTCRPYWLPGRADSGAPARRPPRLRCRPQRSSPREGVISSGREQSPVRTARWQGGTRRTNTLQPGVLRTSRIPLHSLQNLEHSGLAITSPAAHHLAEHLAAREPARRVACSQRSKGNQHLLTAARPHTLASPQPRQTASEADPAVRIRRHHFHQESSTRTRPQRGRFQPWALTPLLA